MGRQRVAVAGCTGWTRAASWRRGGPAGERIVNLNTLKTLGGYRTAAVIGLAGALFLSSGRAALAQSNESASKNGPEGTWMVQVTLRDCSTNAQIGFPYSSLVTFHRGGTISETTSSGAFAVGQRSDGQGRWGAEGDHAYSQRMINLINFKTDPNLPFSPGFLAGWSVVSHTLELSDADHGTSFGTNEFYKTDGTLYRTGCSTAVSVRFE